MPPKVVVQEVTLITFAIAAEWLAKKCMQQTYLMAWRMVVLRINLEAQTSEVARLKVRLGKKADSIWNMNKEALVEVARNELGMTQAQASQETLVILRERIRRIREFTKEVLDPLSQLPKGLGSMSLEDLKAEVIRRDLPMSPGRHPTRAALQIAIRDAVAFRISSSTTAQTPSLSAANTQEWDMVDQAKKVKKGDRS